MGKFTGTSTKKWCKNADDIPKDEHFAIIESGSVHIPQESSDYPAYTQNYVEYISFLDREEWEAEIQNRMSSQYGNKKFVAIHVKPAKVETTHTVVLEIS